MVADAAGVVVVPQGIAVELLERLNAHKAANAEYLQSVKRGDFSNAWVDRTLEEQHCLINRGPSVASIVPPSPEAQPASVNSGSVA